MADTKAVLITGGSGYLGQHLIHSLAPEFKVHQ
jgi:nucleoside-diphosphate-sugar epimerase